MAYGDMTDKQRAFLKRLHSTLADEDGVSFADASAEIDRLLSEQKAHPKGSKETRETYEKGAEAAAASEKARPEPQKNPSVVSERDRSIFASVALQQAIIYCCPDSNDEPRVEIMARKFHALLCELAGK